MLLTSFRFLYNKPYVSSALSPTLMQGKGCIIIISVAIQSGGSLGGEGEEGSSDTLNPSPPPPGEPAVIWPSLCAPIRVLENNVRVCLQTDDGSSSLALLDRTPLGTNPSLLGSFHTWSTLAIMISEMPESN